MSLPTSYSVYILSKQLNEDIFSLNYGIVNVSLLQAHKQDIRDMPVASSFIIAQHTIKGCHYCPL